VFSRVPNHMTHQSVVFVIVRDLKKYGISHVFLNVYQFKNCFNTLHTFGKTKIFFMQNRSNYLNELTFRHRVSSI